VFRKFYTSSAVIIWRGFESHSAQAFLHFFGSWGMWYQEVVTLVGPGLAEHHPVHPETLRFCFSTVYILFAFSS
jgi:hypothetical protein